MTDNDLANGERSSWLSLYLFNHDCGRVTGLFKHSLNIQFSGILFHLGRKTETLSCLGITLPDDQVMSILRQVSVDDQARFINGTIYLYTQMTVLAVPVMTLKEVNLTVPTNLSPTLLPAALAKFQRIPFQEKWGLANMEQASRLSNQLLSANLAADIQAVAGHLVGRGRGLTPSGDDIMVGFTTALTAFQDPRAALWRETLAMLAKQNVTTSVSVAYLRAASERVASQKLIHLIAALKQGSTTDILAAIQSVENFGHTSGIDTLFGFATGLTARLSE
ncbi:MAG: DUF2877 domain-containing protein [Levilactobacillus sp.]|jgi:hypothetical protein|uniref:DUF2877 domain-containing protein n=1 Tax=Levilactobacillus sp. TaxID=2767919 RepID=UPI00258FB13A|nr:DUF2877 domain-containing protein [Levilactobacillus sp.]MCI1553627.1 DUF2877 domain-containing protein [Levilactobacillus sp.]MCI1598624.1 DUF2877 domain-containing protein [Levilactobacillus sp.]MCI1605272.1 DUF2877 domain-containing protein [Levilactobacillus sp.]